MRLRLLPLTIFVAALMLSVRIGALWTGDGRPALAIADLQAQQGGAADAASAAVDPAAAGAAGDPAAADPAAAGEGQVPDSEALAKELEALIEQEPLIDAAPELTKGELEVLQSLRERREALDDREAELDLRQRMVEAAELNLESRIEEWRRLKGEVEGLLARYQTAEDDELQTLATYYEKMKPKDAARVFNTLDLPYLIDIVGRMKEAKVADIIGKMDTQQAKTLTVELARRHEPGVGDEVSLAR